MIKRTNFCLGCEATDELVPASHNVTIHTVCPKCGTGGHNIHFDVFLKSYTEMREKLQQSDHLKMEDCKDKRRN